MGDGESVESADQSQMDNTVKRSQELLDSKILITGATGQVAAAVVRELVKTNRICALGRFRGKRGAAARERLVKSGVACIEADIAEDSFDDLPADLDYVLNFANVKSFDGSFDYDLAANVEGVGRLMSRLQGIKGFLHCSSTAVYQAAGAEPRNESDALGDNHRAVMPTYSICKIAAESMVRFAARQWRIPTTIARLNVPYGDFGGWPAFHLDMIAAGQAIEVHENGPSFFNPIHEDDYVADLLPLLDAADTTATVVNWGGTEMVSIEEWSTFLGECIGREPKFTRTTNALESVVIDTAKMRKILPERQVHWRDGMRRLVEARQPSR